ncbi:hypothetical protein [Lysinibacillus sp. JNUCC 51]|uniref:hypothetical protein n=1 Tax=Lysinibacillus sp. JNUCC-51 TaxID=2792479 RepID=UPI001936D376|nr:hypothetical protein JNUCC51_09755 [Lysinibacillus sp. JNUCC-51]
MSRLGQQMFFPRKRSANVATAKGVHLRESEAAAATAPMLVTKALSQDVMVLAFVPLLLIPKESPSLHSNQPRFIAYISTNISSNFYVKKMKDCDKSYFNL